MTARSYQCGQPTCSMRGSGMAQMGDCDRCQLSRIKKCAFPQCRNPARARGYCVAHHRQWLRCGGDKSALLPLREKPSAAMESVAIRLPPPVAHRVREDVEGARSALVIWAKKAEGKR